MSIHQQRAPIDIEAAHAAFQYDVATGVLTWAPAPGTKRQRFAGRVAGHIDADKYVVVRLNGRLIGAHRLIWAMWHNEQPPALLDHINGDRADNRIVNLRAATHQQNMVNRAAARKNKSGLKGVRQRGERWLAQITLNRRGVFLGSFATAEAAAAAYGAAAARSHGPFLNLGKERA